MAPERVYFDHNATAPLLPEARDAVMSVLGAAANPSSVHTEGRRARETVEAARAAVAALVGAEPANVIFTSGASEAANLALSPFWSEHGDIRCREHLAVCASDHPCLTAGGRFEAERVRALPIERSGALREDLLRDWSLSHDHGLLALALANSESGVVQPLDPVRRALKGRDHLLVLDVVQAAGRMPLDMNALGADALILSGHKIGSLGGVGALVLRDGARAPRPLIRGGAQEHRLRAGTEAVAAIASFGAAATVAKARGEAERAAMLAKRERLEERLRAAHAGLVIVGEGAARLPNTVLLAAPGLKGETAQIALDLQGFAVSAGSACASGKVSASPVLAAHAMAGLPVDPAAGALRLSFGFDTTNEAVDAMGEATARLLQRAARSHVGERAA